MLEETRINLFILHDLLDYPFAPLLEFGSHFSGGRCDCLVLVFVWVMPAFRAVGGRPRTGMIAWNVRTGVRQATWAAQVHASQALLL